MTMAVSEKQLIWRWAVLVCLTLLSLEGSPLLGTSALAAAVVLAIAFAKVRIVVRDFMEVRHAPRWLRLVLELWGVVVCATLIFIIARS